MRASAAICVGALCSLVMACGGSKSGIGDGGLAAGGAGSTGTVPGGLAGSLDTGNGGTAGPAGSTGTDVGSTGGSVGGSSTGNTGVGGSTGDSGTCKAFVACGGEIEGTWELTSTCLSGDLAASMNATASTAPAACHQMYRDVTADMRGTVTFAGGTLNSRITTTINLKMQITPACASELTDVSASTVSASTCATLESELNDGEFNSATCLVVAGNCECELVAISSQTDNESYALSGSQVVDPAGDSQPMDYCVTGSTLTLKQISSDDPDVTMIMTLRRQ